MNVTHLFGIDLSNKKKLRYGLTNIFGIGLSRANIICNKLGLSVNYPLKKVSQMQLSRIGRFIEQQYIIEGELNYTIQNNITRLLSINNYRGFRHMNNLPVRGQRTHTNAKTAKKLVKRYV